MFHLHPTRTQVPVAINKDNTKNTDLIIFISLFYGLELIKIKLDKNILLKIPLTLAHKFLFMYVLRLYMEYMH